MAVWRDKVYKYWIYQFQYHLRSYGERGFTTRREAEAAQAKRRIEVKTQVKTSEGSGFKKIAYEYLEFAERKFVKDVVYRKQKVLGKFSDTLPDKEYPIEQITPQNISAYLTTLASNSQYNEHRHELSAFFNWVRRIYVRELPQFFNPCLNVEALTHEEKEKRPPTMEDVQRMIVAATPGDEQDLLIILLQTLGRISEILRLRWLEDVNFEKRIIILWTRKRKDGKYEPDALPMNNDLYTCLKSRWDKRIQDRWVFYDPIAEDKAGYNPRMMTEICQRAGIAPIGHAVWKINGKSDTSKKKKKIREKQVDLYYGFHHLRHFMATYLMDEEKVSLKTTSTLLRHKHVRTTERYTHKVDVSQLAATDQILGKFTLKNAKPLQDPLQNSQKN